MSSGSVWITLAPLIVAVIITTIVLLVVIIFGLRFMGSQTELSERLNVYAEMPNTNQRRVTARRMNQFARMRYSVNNFLLAFTPETLTLQISSANWPITETEYLLVRLWGAIFGMALGWWVSKNPFPGIGLAIVAYLVPGVLLKWSMQRRQEAFERQMVDILVLISGAVRAGYSLVQSLEVVVRELKAPASEEISRVLREISLGLPASQALLNLYDRMQNDDLYLVVTAININMMVGGNLAAMLDAVTDTIRDRIRLFAEVRMLTSQQRFNSYLLTLMPVGVGAALFILNPTYLMRLFEPTVFICIPIGAVFSVIIGNIAINRLGKIEV